MGVEAFSCGSGINGDYIMRKIVLTLAALAAVGFVVPMITSAKAEENRVVIKEHGERHHMDRGHHYGWDRGHRNQVVVIKHRRHHDY